MKKLNKKLKTDQKWIVAILFSKVQEQFKNDNVQMIVDLAKKRAYAMIDSRWHSTKLSIKNLVERAEPRWFVLDTKEIQSKRFNKLVLNAAVRFETKALLESPLPEEPPTTELVQVAPEPVEAVPFLGEKRAVCTLVKVGSLYLTVSRKGDPSDIGLPGGKVEANETLCQAAIRETLEETGFTVTLDTTNVYKATDDYGYEVVTFIAEIDQNTPKADIDFTKERGVVTLRPKDALLKGSFGKYNLNLFEWYEQLPK